MCCACWGSQQGRATNAPSSAFPPPRSPTLVTALIRAPCARLGAGPSRAGAAPRGMQQHRDTAVPCPPARWATATATRPVGRLHRLSNGKSTDELSTECCPPERLPSAVHHAALTRMRASPGDGAGQLLGPAVRATSPAQFSGQRRPCHRRMQCVPAGSALGKEDGAAQLPSRLKPTWAAPVCLIEPRPNPRNCQALHVTSSEDHRLSHVLAADRVPLRQRQSCMMPMSSVARRPCQHQVSHCELPALPPSGQ